MVPLFFPAQSLIQDCSERRSAEWLVKERSFGNGLRAPLLKIRCFPGFGEIYLIGVQNIVWPSIACARKSSTLLNVLICERYRY